MAEKEIILVVVSSVNLCGEKNGVQDEWER